MSPKQKDPKDGDVMSALPRTRPHRSTARRAAARQAPAARPATTARAKAARPKPVAAVKAAPAPDAGYATRDAQQGAPAAVEAVKGAIEGIVKGLRSRVPFLPKG